MFNPEQVERRQGCLAGQDDAFDHEYVLASDYDQLLEMYKDADHSLKQHNKSDEETWKHRERLQKLLPPGYLGWHFTEAAAAYIERLQAQIEDLCK